MRAGRPLRRRDRQTPRARPAGRAFARHRPSRSPGEANNTSDRSKAATARASAAARAVSLAAMLNSAPCALTCRIVCALGGGNAGDGRDLIEDEVLRLPRRNVQLAAAEAGEIGKTRVGADRDPVRGGEPDGRAQHRRVATVEPGGDVCRRDRGHEPGVVTDRVRAEGFADVGVEIDPHKTPKDHEGHRGHKGKTVASAGSGIADAYCVQNKGTSRYSAMPPCSASLAPPAIHGTCRNQTGDLQPEKAMGVPGQFAGNRRPAPVGAYGFVAALTDLSREGRGYTAEASRQARPGSGWPGPGLTAVDR